MFTIKRGYKLIEQFTSIDDFIEEWEDNADRYATDNEGIAKVSKKGSIKAVGKGKCNIYVYAQNGCAKKIQVTVK